MDLRKIIKLLFCVFSVYSTQYFHPESYENHWKVRKIAVLGQKRSFSEINRSKKDFLVNFWLKIFIYLYFGSNLTRNEFLFRKRTWNENAYFYRIRWKRFVFVELDDSVRYLSDRLFKCKFRTGRVLKSMGRLIVVNAKTETIIFYELEVLNQCKNIKMSKHTHPYCILLFHSKHFLPSFTLHMIFMFRNIVFSKTTISEKS